MALVMDAGDLRQQVGGHRLGGCWSEELHCKPRHVEPAYIECGNGAGAMQVSQVNLLELAPTF